MRNNQGVPTDLAFCREEVSLVLMCGERRRRRGGNTSAEGVPRRPVWFGLVCVGDTVQYELQRDVAEGGVLEG